LTKLNIQRESNKVPIKGILIDNLDCSKDIFRGFHTLCSLVAHFCGPDFIMPALYFTHLRTSGTDPPTHILRWLCVRDICVQFLVKLYTPNGRPETKSQKKSGKPEHKIRCHLKFSGPVGGFLGIYRNVTYMCCILGIQCPHFHPLSPLFPHPPISHTHTKWQVQI